MSRRISEQDLFTSKVQTINKYHQAFITLRAPLVKALRLSAHDTVIQRLEGDSIVISKANITPANSGDGVVH